MAKTLVALTFVALFCAVYSLTWGPESSNHIGAPYRTFNLNSQTNVVAYWGQGDGGDPPLRGVCGQSAYDVIIISFITKIGNYQTPYLDSDYFQQSDIDYCHQQGKTMMISIGGGGTTVAFVSDADAENGAQQVWDLFLGGSGGNRPYGNVIFDGIDLDIESGAPNYWPTFTKLKSLYNSDNRQYYFLSAAPQCPFSDAQMGPDGTVWNGNPIHGSTISKGWLDFLNLQFYNNPGCQVPDSGFNLNTWSQALGSSVSNNRNMKIQVGIPGSPSAAGSGYVDPSQLPVGRMKGFNNFSGIMFWDVQAAQSNNNFQGRVKQALLNGA